MGLSAFLSTQVIDTTSVGRSVMTAADAAAARAAIGAGTSSFDGAFSSLSGKPTTLSGYGITDAQPLDSDLTAIAALTTTTYGRSLLTGADAAATRTTLGLGTLATQSGTFSGTSSGTNTGDQTITLTGDVTGSGTGSFSTTIANSAVTNAMLAGSIAISKLAITGTPDGTKFLRDDGTWAAASGGSGLTSLNGLTGSTQTFAVGTSGTDFAISSTGTAHTFNIPDAGASARGLVTTGTQTFAGAKTFSTSLSSPTLSLTNDSAVSAGLNFVYSTNGGIIANNGTRAILFNAGGITFSQNTFIDTNIRLTVNGFITGASNVLDVRNSTNAQTFNIANTYTSSTNFEYGRLQWSSNEWRIGTAVGSAGGTQRSTVFGSWNAAGTFTAAMTVNTAGTVAISRLGIGAGTPDLSLFRLHIIDSDTSLVGFYVQNTAATGTGQPRLAILHGGTTSPVTAWNNRSVIEGQSSNGLAVGADTGNLYLYSGRTNWDTGLTVNTSNRVLIGKNTDDGAKFQVSGSSTFASGTITSSSPGITLTQTWNNAAVSFVGMSIDITKTAATLYSPIFRARQGATSLFEMRADDGTFTCGAVSVTDQGYSRYSFATNGGNAFRADLCGVGITTSFGGISLGSSRSISWSSTTNWYDTADIFLHRDAAGTLAQRNSTNAQTFNIANTWTSSTSFEYGRFQWNTNEFRIGTAVGSAGGTQRSTVIGSWNAAGTFSPFLTIDNAGATTITGSLTSTGGGLVLSSNTSFAWQHGGSGTKQIEVNSGVGTALRWSSTSFILNSNGATLTPGAATSGSQTGFTFTAPAPTGQTASTEATMVNWNLASTVTFAAGALTTQRAFRIQAPTYAFASASTITTASTLSISGAPAAGTNATIANAYALNIESGNSVFQGTVTAGNLSNGNIVLDSGSGAPKVSGYYATAERGFIRFAGGTGHDIQINSMASGGAVYVSFNNTPSAYFTLNQVELRNSTNAQTFRVYNTYTSATSAEWFQQSWASNEARIGTAVGSAGGTVRDIVIGTWDSAGNFTTGLTITRATLSGEYLSWRGGSSGSATALSLRVSGVTNYIYFGGNVLCAGGTSVNNNITFYPPLRYVPNAQTSGAITEWQWTAAAHTGQTASTEASSVVFDLSATKTFAAGALTTQRAFRIQAPTYAFASASTVTNAATLSISGAPAAGTNATLTNSYALWVEAGMSQFGGIINTTAALVLNTGSQAFNTSYHFVSWNGGCLGWSSSGTVNSTSSLDTAFKRVSAGLIEINNGTAGTYRDLVLRNLRMSAPTVPATASDTGSEGQISWDANYIYVCTATNTWKRAALATW